MPSGPTAQSSTAECGRGLRQQAVQIHWLLRAAITDDDAGNAGPAQARAGQREPRRCGEATAPPGPRSTAAPTRARQLL